MTEHTITLDARESHHLIRVFRARVGERVELLDGRGTRYFGRIQKADARAAVIGVEGKEAVTGSGLDLVLLQALPKGKAMDLILRMVTEIGLSTVQPVYTSQSEVRLPRERMEGKLDKWRATTVEACKQCGLSFLPEVCPPENLLNWLGQNPPAEGELRLVASLEGGARLLLEALEASAHLKRVVLAVGPEGDFSKEEYQALSECGFLPVRLGRNVLRAETATAYLLSVIDQFLLRSA